MKQLSATTALLLLTVLLSTALPLIACRAGATTPRTPDRMLGDVSELEIVNVRAPLPGVLTGGQINQEQMTALAEAGYRTFINLRGVGEKGTGWESELADTLGVQYASIPVSSADDVTEANARLLAAELEADPVPALVYCASGNRVGALLALRAWYVQGMSPEDALALGQAAGLTRLEPVVRERLGL